jgi:hypothetical protein
MVSETVYGTLGEWVSKPLAKLPRELQSIATAYIPKWQTLTPKQRTDRAIEVDRQRGLKSKLRHDRAVRAQQAAHDPVEDAYWWDLFMDIDDKKKDIKKWEAMPEPLPSEALAKEQRLHTLRGELSALETKYKAPYPAPPVADTTSAEPQAVPVVTVVALGEPGKAVPLPLTTSDIAFCFAGLRWSEQQWKKPLGDKPKWLSSCIAIPGARGKSETRWNPVLIGAALVLYGHAGQNNIRAKFRTKPQLAPWFDAWKTYEADSCDTA